MRFLLISALAKKLPKINPHPTCPPHSLECTLPQTLILRVARAHWRRSRRNIILSGISVFVAASYVRGFVYQVLFSWFSGFSLQGLSCIITRKGVIGISSAKVRSRVGKGHNTTLCSLKHSFFFCATATTTSSVQRRTTAAPGAVFLWNEYKNLFQSHTPLKNNETQPLGVSRHCFTSRGCQTAESP